MEVYEFLSQGQKGFRRVLESRDTKESGQLVVEVERGQNRYRESFIP